MSRSFSFSLRWLCFYTCILLCLSACRGKPAPTSTSAPTFAATAAPTRPAPATATLAPSTTLAPALTETTIAHLGESTALLQTTDGGQTWAEIKPVAGP